MIIPKLHGTFNHTGFTIFTACDDAYFNEFGIVLVNSIRQNTSCNVHLHIFNPSADTLQWLIRNSVSYTYELLLHSKLLPATQFWKNPPLDDFNQSRLQRIHKSIEKGNDSGIHDRIIKTYYACTRFIRLAQIFTGGDVLAIDIDAIVRKHPSELPDTKDFYIHKNTQYLAGGIYLNENSIPFLQEYAAKLEDYITNDYLYWSLDQDVLDSIVPKYNFGELPRSYIDWNMHPDSYVWTAKGKRKELDIFKNEKLKYIS